MNNKSEKCYVCNGTGFINNKSKCLKKQIILMKKDFINI